MNPATNYQLLHKHGGNLPCLHCCHHYLSQQLVAQCALHKQNAQIEVTVIYTGIQNSNPDIGVALHDTGKSVGQCMHCMQQPVTHIIACTQGRHIVRVLRPRLVWAVTIFILLYLILALTPTDLVPTPPKPTCSAAAPDWLLMSSDSHALRVHSMAEVTLVPAAAQHTQHDQDAAPQHICMPKPQK